MPFDKNTEHLITLDVEALYSNIPQEATLEVRCELLERNVNDSRTPPEYILDRAHLALTRNYFEFENQFFLQTQGTSMGSTFAPSLACLYVDNFEKKVVLHEDNPYLEHIRLWKRYIDDILPIWAGSRDEAHSFITWLNMENPFLTFTMTIGNDQLPFLDLLIHESDGVLATEVYQKPTDRNNLLQFKSFHPRSLRENLPVGQFLRLQRNCSKVSDYHKHANALSAKLLERESTPTM
ncbi:hypothetical protein NDU88_002631 [Pleurodeles waltl]|uniref:Reverse transcriptase domain-containing protein n=1 Tax=Pleurodeles waltl TaxID=8319 RepID=A0AAV7KVA3_PLEWA|nr:hypothetical protein NDU88_002631 [Pleurodeles waltl]